MGEGLGKQESSFWGGYIYHYVFHTTSKLSVQSSQQERTYTDFFYLAYSSTHSHPLVPSLLRCGQGYDHSLLQANSPGR